MTMHNDGEDDWFFDEDDGVPWWRIVMGYVIAAALIGIVLAIVARDAFAYDTHPDGSVTMDKGEVEDFNRETFMFLLKIELQERKIEELKKSFEELEARKCT
jgi:hypothetical protein